MHFYYDKSKYNTKQRSRRASGNPSSRPRPRPRASCKTIWNMPPSFTNLPIFISAVYNVEENCSFPYTYNGRLFYGCMPTMYDPSDECTKYACLVSMKSGVLKACSGNQKSYLFKQCWCVIQPKLTFFRHIPVNATAFFCEKHRV